MVVREPGTFYINRVRWNDNFLRFMLQLERSVEATKASIIFFDCLGEDLTSIPNSATFGRTNQIKENKRRPIK